MNNYEIFQYIGMSAIFLLILYACYWIGFVHKIKKTQAK